MLKFLLLLILSEILIAETFEIDNSYKLVWEEDFKDKDLNLSKWMYRYLGKRANATNTMDTVHLVNNDYLELSLLKNNEELYSSMISTQNLKEFLYGYFEIKFKLPLEKGLQSAFWLQSEDFGKYIGNVSQSGAEIDIFEHISRKPEFIYHSIYYDGYKKQNIKKQQKKIKIDMDNEWHIVSLLWDKESYSFYYNNELVYKAITGISQRPQYIILSVENTEWSGKTSTTFKKDSFLIDYIKVYQKKEKIQ